MKLIVTGSRHWIEDQLVVDALALFHDRLVAINSSEDLVIIHGNCPTGADLFADRWGRKFADKVTTYPADWNQYGRAGGPIRNQQMVDENLDADYVLAFPLGESRGTRHCMDYAASKGLTVINLGER